MTSESEDLAARWAQDVASRGWGNYQYGLVMEAGDRDLMTVLDKERLDIDQGCQVCCGSISLCPPPPPD